MPWHPKDENSVPTLLEQALAKDAIDILQQEMRETLKEADRLEQELQATRTKMEQIEQEISKRTAWLAPIRRIPADILRMLFIEACQDDWRAPLILGAVCSRWRDVLISTPRAWAYIQITPFLHPFHHELVHLWLSRCGALRVHISLRPHASGEMVDAVCRHGQNLKCLSFFGNVWQLQRRYPHLEELRLGPCNLLFEHGAKNHVGDGDAEGELKSDRFPKLASLHLHGPSDSIMEVIARQSISSLRNLHIQASGCHWLRIIQACANFLTTLVVEINSSSKNMVSKEELDKPITCSQLQHLHYVNVPVIFAHENGPLHWPYLLTPHLQSYHEFNGTGVSPMHADVSSITSLFFHSPKKVAWASFLSLTHLRLQCHGSASLMNETSVLGANPKLCPKLSSVECVVLGLGRSREADAALCMANRTLSTGISINLQYQQRYYDQNVDEPWVRESSLSISFISLVQCFTFCKSHSTPNPIDWDPHYEKFISQNRDDSDEEYDGHGYNEFGDLEDDFSANEWDEDSSVRGYLGGLDD